MRFVDLMIDGKFCQTVTEFYKLNWIAALNWRAWQITKEKELQKLRNGN